ncbi:MAG TPA: VOC family protein [Candidatus Acidoferrum sp.]|jgi:catechol 2,3-dioxygenase-like lactoylglutathione lyase family enzyme
MKSHLYIVQLVLILTLRGLAFTAEAQVKAVATIGMTVSDVDRATEFYSALTFQRVSDVEVFGDEYEHLVGVFGARMRMVRMQLGGEFIELTEYLTPRGRPIPEDSRSNDLWFRHIAIVVSDMEKAFEKLRALKVNFVSTGPQQLPAWNIAAAGIKAIRAGSGPGIEFLEYLTPRGGRLRPIAKANDLIHWQTTLITPDVEALASKLRAEHADFISSGVNVVPKDKFGFGKGLLVRDPDGHAMLLIEE